MYATLPAQPTEDRRQSHRAPISIAVRKKIGNQVLLCQASNISTEGIFVAHVLGEDARLARGKCWLEFSLPGSGVLIAVRGQVLRQFVYARFLVSAIRFTSIAPSHRRLIKQYIQGPPVAAPSPTFLPPIPRG